MNTIEHITLICNYLQKKISNSKENQNLVTGTVQNIKKYVHNFFIVVLFPVEQFYYICEKILYVKRNFSNHEYQRNLE